MSSYVANAVDYYDKIYDLVHSQSEWSQKTFGSDEERGPVGALRHLEIEAREACEEWRFYRSGQSELQDVKEEFADCFLLLLDASRRAGLSFQELLDAAVAKHEKNKRREWPKVEAGGESPVLHVKDEVAVGNE
jgi:NTP pyrophosphatase (non-canonical NTP hydrolase)